VFSFSISDDSRIMVTKDQVSCDLAGETAVLNLKNGVYYGFADPVGVRIWSLVQTPITIRALRDAIMQEFEVEEEQCERELLAVLQKLASEALIEIKNETSA